MQFRGHDKTVKTGSVWGPFWVDPMGDMLAEGLLTEHILHTYTGLRIHTDAIT